MNTDEIATLNEAFAKIADLPERVEEAQAIVAKTFEFKEDYYNPLYCYDSAKLLIELRGKLITFVIKKATDGVNYEINEREVFDYINNTLGTLNFDAQKIVDYINENYEAKADELSLETIKKTMESLVPRMNGPNWSTRKPERDELLKKDTLILRCYLGWEYGFKRYEFMERMEAFEKYVAIELVGESPSKAEALWFKQTYSGEDDGLGIHNMNGSFYQSVQIHKNGTLRVRFKPGYAEKIAKAILRDFYKETE